METSKDLTKTIRHTHMCYAWAVTEFWPAPACMVDLKDCYGQLETVEMETGNGKWKWKTETVKT